MKNPTDNLSKSELKIFKRLNTPIKIQDFLDTFPINWEKKGETYMSPRRVLRKKKMHCFEGALLAATALWLNGQKPLLLDLQAEGDDDHVVALYRKNGYWGAISKTNHAVLRFRDPVYKDMRELALSYFHEYADNRTKNKTLRRYSAKPFDLSKIGVGWIASDKDLHYVRDEIDKAPHKSIIPSKNKNFIRKSDKMEMKAGKIIEWKKNDPRT